MQSLQDIDEVNMFKDDFTVIHLKRPQTQFSVRENLLVVAGNPETKNLKDMMPDILKQVGPQQYQFLKQQLGNLDSKKDEQKDDDDDVPELVGTFEDTGKKWALPQCVKHWTKQLDISICWQVLASFEEKQSILKHHKDLSIQVETYTLIYGVILP